LDHTIDFSIRLQHLIDDDDFFRVREQLGRCCTNEGGTSIYSALLVALQVVEAHEDSVESTWIVCLTDGVSDDIQMQELQRKI
jgi:Mg-chelatase subunit ChlD